MDDAIIDRIARAVAAVLPLEKATKKEGDGHSYPPSAYLVVEDPDKASTFHLRVKDENGYSRTLCGAAWAALHGGYRGQKYQGPNKAEALARLKRIYTSQGWDLPDSDDGVSKAETEPVRVMVRFDKAQPALKHGVIFGVASTTRRDREGDEIDADELETMAYRFMAKANKRATDTHGPDIAGDFVASWVDAGAGTWRVGFRPHDRAIAHAAAAGAYVGFSVGGSATREEV